MHAMPDTVRVRFAPSPTGEPHLGNIRSALFNWLFARSSGGSFIVRIEDTDQNRKVDGATEALLDSLRWLGLDWDEGPGVGGPYGPYVQSERLATYEEHSERLIAGGRAYRCYCTPEQLAAMRKQQQAEGRPQGYDRRCRELTEGERSERAAENPSPVVRFKMPLSGQIAVPDFVRGEVVFDASLLDDFVLLKSDGFPTYHLANVVDDHLMEITHVMRAEEWLPSAPRHQELYAALGFEMPTLVHLPIILGPDRSKLSKRHGATSALWYRDEGYLADAMVNFLARLGWSLDDSTEVIGRGDLVGKFSLDRILASPAVFDRQKLDWLNGVYIRELPLDELCRELTPFLEAGLPASVARPIDRDYLARIVPLERERLHTLAEASEMLSFFFVDDPGVAAGLPPKGMSEAEARVALERSLALAESSSAWDAASLEGAYRALADEVGVKTGQLFGAIRAAITGRTAAPPLFDTMAVLGRDRCVARMRRAIESLGDAVLK